jgi:hypothetical protein
MIIPEFFPDKFTIITERSKSQGQIFLCFRGEDGNTYFKAVTKTGYQVLGPFFQKDIYHLHAGKYIILQV